MLSFRKTVSWPFFVTGNKHLSSCEQTFGLPGTVCSSLNGCDKETDAQLDILLENSELNCENKPYPSRAEAAEPDSLDYNVKETD